MNTESSLGRGRREGVRIRGAEEGARPRRSIAGEIIGGEFGEGIESEEREEGEEFRRETGGG